jgi:AcrR family transcriptional regulator
MDTIYEQSSGFLLAFDLQSEMPRMVMKVRDPYRKRPVQARSATTVAAILEATARILNGSKGASALNTNAIAATAGISIGTLYQYFPDKNAILIALARQELQATSGKLVAALDRTSSEDVQDLPRVMVHGLLKAFGGRQRTRKLLIESLIANGLSDELARPVEAVVQALLVQPGGNRMLHITPVRIFVMTRAVIGAIRAAVMEQSPWLNHPAFEDELVALINDIVSRQNPGHHHSASTR